MNVWCDRLGSSLASTWGGPFFGAHKVGAPVELQKCSKTFYNKWFGVFSEDPFWVTSLGEERSPAAWRSFSGFPKRSHAARRSFWSTKRFKHKGFGARHSFRGSLGESSWGELLGRIFALWLQEHFFQTRT